MSRLQYSWKKTLEERHDVACHKSVHLRYTRNQTSYATVAKPHEYHRPIERANQETAFVLDRGLLEPPQIHHFARGLHCMAAGRIDYSEEAELAAVVGNEIVKSDCELPQPCQLGSWP